MTEPERPAETVVRFLGHFYAGRMAEARAMVSEDFSFRAPLVDDGSKDAYFHGAEAKVEVVRDVRLVRQWESGADVSTLYEIDVETGAGAASMPMYEWHHVRGGLIASMVLVFDTVAPAAELIRVELGH